MDVDTPRMLKAQMNERDHKLRMDGDLLGNHDDAEVLGSIFRQIAGIGGEWSIDSDGMRIIPDGARLWVSLASEFLAECRLVYEPSQLCLVLKYEDRYKHPASSFIEPWDRPAAKRPLSATIIR